MREPRRWDIFCRVVDNFGDAGVCWRLARALAHERGDAVRLWIDDLATLARLEPALAADAHAQDVNGIAVRRWDDRAHTPEDDALPDVVVEAFGCALPPRYVERMAGAASPPVWIVLEYLSAEEWVRAHHGLPSPHPRLPLERYFFFPGFVEGTGGLLRERGLFERRDAFGAAEREAFWRSVGHAAPTPDALVVSLFAYDTAPVAELLRCWAAGPRRVVAAVPEGPLAARVLAHFGAAGSAADRVLRDAALEVRLVPFVPQSRYDELLWSCDVNFVRGEDSFVRAQWAGRGFVWHIYPQQERVHGVKLEAFLDVYCAGMAAGTAAAARDLMRLWNRFETPGVSPASAWAAFAAQCIALRDHTRAWAERAAAAGELAANLAAFCRGRLK